MRGLLGIGLALLVGLAGGTAWADVAQISGVVRVDVTGLRIADVRPMVVYLEPIVGEAAAAGKAGRAHEIRQRNAKFAPGFLAVGVGDSVSMPNDDTIYHNVFSFSESNAFDLGLYPAGELRNVRFSNPGVVRIYCSIHESMNGLLFVAPSRWFARPADDGTFSFAGVPPGRWRLRVWAEKLPPVQRSIELQAGPNRVELSLGP